MQGIRNIHFSVKHQMASLMVITCIWYFLYIHSLSAPIIQQWDEARNAVNTQEMLQNGKWLVRYFQGNPETWELKPPFLIWAQCLSTKIWGVTEFGIRFPSAMAALGIAYLAFWFLYREGVSAMVALFCAVTAITIPATLHPHGFLFGDHDAMLCFFQALILVASYLFLTSGKMHWAWISALGLLLGWLTKSIAVGFILPGILALALLDANYRKNLFTFKWMVPFACSGICIASYYWVREQLQPGYIHMVNLEEWMGRFTSKNNANTDVLYYLKGFSGRLQGFLYAGIVSLVWVAFKWKHKPFSRLGLATICFTLPIISFSHSKNFWYDLPLIFPLVICMAHFLNDWIDRLCAGFPKLSFTIVAIGLFFQVKSAYGTVLSHNHQSNPNKKELLVAYLKNHTFSKTQKYGVYCNAFNTDVSFYLNNLNRNGYSFMVVEPNEVLGDMHQIFMAREDFASWRALRKELLMAEIQIIEK
jgi:4-amino-4-deoxy-L-arabinose transferase-like glycosyltransferase